METKVIDFPRDRRFLWREESIVSAARVRAIERILGRYHRGEISRERAIALKAMVLWPRSHQNETGH